MTPRNGPNYTHFVNPECDPFYTHSCVDTRSRILPSSPPSVAPQTWPEASESDRQKEPAAHDGAIKRKELGTERPLSESRIEREGRRELLPKKHLATLAKGYQMKGCFAKVDTNRTY